MPPPNLFGDLGELRAHGCLGVDVLVPLSTVGTALGGRLGGEGEVQRRVGEGEAGVGVEAVVEVEALLSASVGEVARRSAWLWLALGYSMESKNTLSTLVPAAATRTLGHVQADNRLDPP